MWRVKMDDLIFQSFNLIKFSWHHYLFPPLRTLWNILQITVVLSSSVKNVHTGDNTFDSHVDTTQLCPGATEWCYECDNRVSSSSLSSFSSLLSSSSLFLYLLSPPLSSPPPSLWRQHFGVSMHQNDMSKRTLSCAEESCVVAEVYQQLKLH